MEAENWERRWLARRVVALALRRQGLEHDEDVVEESGVDVVALSVDGIGGHCRDGGDVRIESIGGERR
ncbi:hypothetical protein AAVH_30338 [Aphelenchoides avenae]|nr:hypothetical protein AAVH_30338 [Aphelenchus avenae]